MAGNRSKLNKKTIGLIADAISIGANKEIAAGYARITVSCLMHWLQIARVEDERRQNGEVDKKYDLHVELLHAIDDAQADLAIECLSVVQKARSRGETEWAWKMLASKYRDEFGNSQKMELTGSKGGPIVIDWSVSQDDDND